MPKSTTPAGKAANDFPNGTARTKSSELDTSGLSQTLQRHVDDIRSLIQCGICIRPLYEPFTIACGHTFCYDCLANWFSSSRHNKTCPDCRTPVEAQPSPAYLVRAVVQLFTSRAELLDKGETTSEHTKNQREDAEKVERDKKNDDHREGGLFRGAFKPRLPIVAPIVDLEDNVVRCPNCSWELEEDSCCEQCGYSRDLDSANWTDGSGQWSEGEENSEMTDYDDDDAIDDGFGDLSAQNWFADPYNGGPYTLPLPGAFARPETTGWRSNPHTIEDSEGEEDEEEDYDDEDMDSFIDDDEYEDGGQREYESDPSTVVGGPDYSTQDQISSDASRYAHFGMEDEATDEDREEVEREDEREGEETDASDDEVGGIDYEDDEDDEDEDEDPIRPPVTGQRHHRMSGPTGAQMRTSATPWAFNRGQSRASRFGADREIPRDQVSTGTGPSAYNTIDISDDSDEEGPVPPTRRRMPGSFI